MKTLRMITLSAALVGTVAGVAVAEPKARDFEILEKILQTAVSEAMSEPDSPFRGHRRHLEIDSLYLAEQGLVVEAQTRGYAMAPLPDLSGFDSLMEAPLAIAEVMPEVAYSAAEGLASVDWDEVGDDIAEAIEEVYDEDFLSGEQKARLSAEMTAMKQKLSELKARQREMAREIREKNRKLAEERRKAERDSKLADSEREELRESLKAEMESLKETRKDYMTTLKGYQQEREKVARQQMEFIENTLIATLCDYASAVQRLSDDDHLSLVVKQGHGRDSKRQIYIWKSGDIRRCQEGDIKGVALKQQARAYQQ